MLNIIAAPNNKTVTGMVRTEFLQTRTKLKGKSISNFALTNKSLHIPNLATIFKNIVGTA